jgi:hypothetical protein
MNVTPTAGIAAAWSAAKASPNDQAAQLASSRQAKAGEASEEAVEPKKGPPAPEGQGTRVDVRV